MTLKDELKKKCKYKYQQNLGEPSVCNNGIGVQLSFKLSEESELFSIKDESVNQIVFQYSILNPLKALDLAREIQEYAMYCIEEYEKNPQYCVCCDGAILRNDDGSFELMTLKEAQRLQKDMRLIAFENEWTVRPLSYYEFYNEFSEN